MTLSEFRAWLEGFEEGMGALPPNAEQWKAIKAKLAKVELVKLTGYRDALPKGWNDQVRKLEPFVASYRAD